MKNEEIEKFETSECIFSVILSWNTYLGILKENHSKPNLVTQLQVPYSLSRVGIQAILQYQHKTHYIVKPSQTTATQSQVSRFCQEHFDMDAFTYFSRRELIQISKYFKETHGLLFSAVILRNKVKYRYIVLYLSSIIILKNI